MSEKNSIISDDITSAIDNLKEYADLRLQLIRLNITEKIAILLANLISMGAAVIFFILCFIFGSFALSYAIGNMLNNTAAGFGALAGFYLIVALIILWISKRSMRKNLINKFISDFSNDDNNE